MLQLEVTYNDRIIITKPITVAEARDVASGIVLNRDYPEPDVISGFIPAKLPLVGDVWFEVLIWSYGVREVEGYAELLAEL